MPERNEGKDPMIDHLAFTGSAAGMDAKQAIAVMELLVAIHPKYVHEGGCVGADAQFHTLVDMFFPDIVVHRHPGDVREDMVSTYIGDAHVHPMQQPLDRNKTMVDESRVLLATPHREEYQRSGTWATIRYARKQGKPRFIVYPQGELVVEDYSAVWGAVLSTLNFEVGDSDVLV